MSDCRCGHGEGYHGSDLCVAEVDLGVRCPCERFVDASDSCVEPQPPQVTEVWIVMCDAYGDTWVDAVFDSEAKAQAYVAAKPRESGTSRSIEREEVRS